MSKAMTKWKADPRVESAYEEPGEESRYWVHLKTGFCSDPECHTMSAATVKEMNDNFRGVFYCFSKCCMTAEEAAKIQTATILQSQDETGYYYELRFPDGTKADARGRRQAVRQLDKYLKTHVVKVEWIRPNN